MVVGDDGDDDYDDDGDDAERALTKANFLGKTKVAMQFYVKFWAEVPFEFFPKNFFLLRHENFHFLKTFSLYLERADSS